jgi:TetR/AcrR family transcriptional regulator
MSTKERKLKEKENRKEVILKAAEKVMTANGLYGLSIEAIAEETQLAKGTIYLYFKSKDEILSSLTIKARNQLFNEFQLIEKQKSTAYEKLIQMIRMNYNFYKKFPLYYDLVSLYEANHKAVETEEMYKSSQNITNLVQRIAEEAKVEGFLNSKIDPLHLTMSLWGMTVGMLQLLKVRGTVMEENLAITETDLIETYIAIFSKGITN